MSEGLAQNSLWQPVLRLRLSSFECRRIGFPAEPLKASRLQRGLITTANTSSGSTLALQDRNAKIESGTQFVLQTTSTLTLTKEPKQK